MALANVIVGDDRDCVGFTLRHSEATSYPPCWLRDPLHLSPGLTNVTYGARELGSCHS